jgi:hypothetical protein
MTVHFFPRALRALSALAASLVLAGCSLAPVHHRPQAPIPTQWPQHDAAPVLSSAAATLDWGSFIADDRLRRLVDLAQSNNRDLRQTLLNVEAARALYQVQRADRLPGVGLQGGGTRQRLPGDLGATGQPQVQSNWQAGVGLAAFELDLFGRVRNLSEAALAEYLATEEAAQAARISLGAEVVQAYLARDGALRRLDLASRLHGFPAQFVPRAFYAKGNYFTLSGRAPFSRLIYPVPEAAGLGVHLTLDMGGQAKFGPDVQWVEDAGDLQVDPARADAFHAEIRRYWPALPDGALLPGYAGIRPKISGPGEPAADFTIQGPQVHGVAGVVQLLGIESPGLTSCLAIGGHVADLLAQ